MKLRRIVECTAGLGLAALAVVPLRAQFAAPRDVAVVPDGRAGLERAFEPWCRAIDTSVLALYSVPRQGDARRSTAVVVGEDLVLAKLSEIGEGAVHTRLANGTESSGELLATDLESDLALLRIALEGETILELSPGHAFKVGQWIAAAGADGTCVAVGAVSVPPRELPPENHGALGIELDQTFTAGARIARVTEGGAAAAIGLLAGDVIREIDGRPMSSSVSVRSYLRRTLPGQEIQLVLARGETQVVEKVRVRSFQLGMNAERPHAADNIEVSVRRDGFALAVQHDAHVLPRECLAPAIDARGHVVGLHIARMDRPGSLLLPADLVLERLAVLFERAGLAPTGAPAEAGRPAPASEELPREV
jgi:S1-C subfamily serine protease